MSVTNIVRAVVKSGSNYTVTSPIMKEDKGQILLIEGLDLPEAYEIDFSNDRHHGSSITMIGNADGVLIPTQFIKTGRDVFAFYYYVGDGFGQTEHVFRLPNDYRPDRTDEVPDPEEESKIDQAIAALNEAVVKTEENKTAAKNSADSAYEDANRAEQARDAAEGHSRDASNAANQADTSERNAKGYSEAAGRSADAAAESERNAANSAAEAGRKADEITGLTVEAETLTPGSEATADYQNGQLILGIPRGDKGEKGDTGATGPRGPQGIQGEKGETGDTGPKGDKGDQGIQGIQGPKGDKGDTGPQGVKGDTGDTGPKGDKGDQGIQGIQGSKGDKGEKGDKGDKGDTGEVTLADLNTALMDKADIITDSASGSIASFSDGADNLPLKSLVIDINPIQDLHGQDAPYPAGGGKNLLDPNKTVLSPTGAYGFTMERHGDVFRVYGTCTKSGEGAFAVITGYSNDSLSGKGYVVQAFNVTGGVTINTVYGLRTESERQIAIAISRTEGQYYDFSFNISVSAETQASYAPYENICPISGWTQVGVEQRGVNVWDEEWELGDISASTGENVEFNTVVIRTKNYIPVKPNTQYFVYINDSGSGPLRGRFYDINKDFIGTAPKDRTAVTYNQTFTTPDNCYYIRFTPQATYGTTYNHDISINYPSTDHSYHPYTGRSININLGQTVYGGKLNVVTGELVIDRAMVDLGTLDWLNASTKTSGINRFVCYVEDLDIKLPSANNVRANMICDRYATETADGTYLKRQGIGLNTNNKRIFVFDPRYNDVTDFKASFDHLYLCYELAEPIEIQLSANQINSLYGQNNIWADSGDTEVEYRADTKLYIERLTAPDSADMIADANITSGKYFMVGNSLYKATANIANGASIIVGTNCIRKSLSEALNEINA